MLVGSQIYMAGFAALICLRLHIYGFLGVGNCTGLQIRAGKDA